MRKLSIKDNNDKKMSCCILKILTEGMAYFKTTSLIYSQKYILKQLNKRCGVCIKIRQLNTYLKRLEDAGYIRRYRRHIIDPVKGFIFRSTRYYITPKGWLAALSFGLIKLKRAIMMIRIIKNKAKQVIIRIKEWETPDWMEIKYTKIPELKLNPYD